MKNNLSYHNLSVEDATELALDRPLWRQQSYALKWCKLNNDAILHTQYLLLQHHATLYCYTGPLVQ